MGNSSHKPGSTNGNRTLSVFDETIINRGTIASPRPLLKFHTVHGSNITLSDDRLIAKRRPNVFCKGVVFSDRPIEIDEIICIKLTEVCNSWSGVLRFGLTNVDPASFRDIELPKFACPDLTSKTGYWAKALNDRYSIQGSVLHFYISSSGILYVGCNGYNKGTYLHDIDVSKPLWVMMDIYGKSVTVEFLSEITDTIRGTAAKIEQQKIVSKFRLSEPAPPSSGTTSGSPRASASPRFTSPSPSATPTPLLSSLPYQFHTMVGVNATRVSDWEIARKDNEFDRGYCFLSRPIRIDEVISIKVLETEAAFHGAMAFGLTNCKPDILTPTQLPADCDDLLERSEYWAVIKDVAVLPDRGDILSFCLKQDGRLLFAKNRGFPRPIMYMDTSVELWPFFDVFGRTKRIQLTKPQKLNTLSQDSSDSRESSSEPPARPPPPRLPGTSAFISSSTSQPSPALSTGISSPVVRTSTDDVIAAALETSTSILRNMSAYVPRPSEEPLLREPRPSTSIFNLQSSNSGSIPPTERSSTDSTDDYLSVLSRPYTSQTPDNPSQSRSSSNAAFAALNNAENIALRNLATLYSAPRFASSTPQMVTPFMPSHNTASLPTINPRHASPPVVIDTPPPVTPSTISRERSPKNGPSSESSECAICFSAPVNAAVYRCGHCCMCLECARQLMFNQGKCPMCRQAIRDVVQLFFS